MTERPYRYDPGEPPERHRLQELRAVVGYELAELAARGTVIVSRVAAHLPGRHA